MYNNEATERSAITAADGDAKHYLSKTQISNGINESEVFSKHSKPAEATNTLMKGGSESKVCYSNALSNDKVIIIEAPKTVHSAKKDLHPYRDSAVSNTQRQMEIYGHSGIQSNRAGPTIRSLSEAELPQPDTVRRAKDVFENLAKRQNQENALQHQHSFGHGIIKSSNVTTNIGRSQSMLVLTGRAWCNGAPLVANGHHHNGACSDAISGGRAAFYLNVDSYNCNLAKFQTQPTYQRSCSELDKFFQNDNEVDSKNVSGDLWGRFVDNDRGSPVSPEVIQRIRDQGTCVKFFGSEASVVGSTEDESDDDDLFDGNDGYLLEYPYDLYRSINSYSPNACENGISHKPKIIGMVPKTMSDSSLSSSMSSTRRQSETSSPSPSSHNGWIIGGGHINNVSLDDIRASFNGDVMDSSRPNSSLESGYVKLKHYCDQPMNSHQISMAIKRCHGKWMKNPYWQGSYYVIYDFTLKDTDSSPNINGMEFN